MNEFNNWNLAMRFLHRLRKFREWNRSSWWIANNKYEHMIQVKVRIRYKGRKYSPNSNKITRQFLKSILIFIVSPLLQLGSKKKIKILWLLQIFLSITNKSLSLRMFDWAYLHWQNGYFRTFDKDVIILINGKC